MSQSSAIPAAVDAVVSALRSAGIETYDGPGDSQTGAGQYVLVGCEDPEADGAQAAVDGTSQWIGLGAKRREEEFTVHCVAVAWNGDSDMKAARDSAAAVVDAAYTAIQSDPSLGGLLLYAPGVTGLGFRQGQASAGAVVYAPFDIECVARI